MTDATSGPVLSSRSDPDLDHLLDAAAEEIAQYGIGRTSINDIARRAGVSRPTAYRRLGNKDQLLQLILARFAVVFWSDCEVAVHGVVGIPERAGELFLTGLHTAREHPTVARLLADDQDLVLRAWATSDNPQLIVVRERVARALDPDGALSALQARRAADILGRLGLSFLTSPSDVLNANRIRRIIVAAVDAAITSGD